MGLRRVNSETACILHTKLQHTALFSHYTLYSIDIIHKTVRYRAILIFNKRFVSYQMLAFSQSCIILHQCASESMFTSATSLTTTPTCMKTLQQSKIQHGYGNHWEVHGFSMDFPWIFHEFPARNCEKPTALSPSRFFKMCCTMVVFPAPARASPFSALTAVFSALTCWAEPWVQPRHPGIRTGLTLAPLAEVASAVLTFQRRFSSWFWPNSPRAV